MTTVASYPYLGLHAHAVLTSAVVSGKLTVSHDLRRASP